MNDKISELKSPDKHVSAEQTALVETIQFHNRLLELLITVNLDDPGR